MRPQEILSYVALRLQNSTKRTTMNVQGQKGSWFPTITFTLKPDNPTPPVALALDQLYHSIPGQKQFHKPSASSHSKIASGNNQSIMGLIQSDLYFNGSTLTL